MAHETGHRLEVGNLQRLKKKIRNSESGWWSRERNLSEDFATGFY